MIDRKVQLVVRSKIGFATDSVASAPTTLRSIANGEFDEIRLLRRVLSLHLNQLFLKARSIHVGNNLFLPQEALSLTSNLSKHPAVLEQAAICSKTRIQIVSPSFELDCGWSKRSRNREKLYLSERTVKNHITHILKQLNVRDRTLLEQSR